MRFTTKSGSLYEVNTDKKQIRRLIGKDNPTPRVGKDGEWRTYTEMFPEVLEVGKGAVILWDPQTTPLLKGNDYGIPMTTTSSIVSIDNSTSSN